MPYNKYEDGEYIALYWEYGDPDVHYVRGHVDQATFRAALESYHGDIFFYGDPPELELRHAYAFWALSGHDGYGNVDRQLKECQRRRGAFKVTALDVPSEAERDAKKLAALGAKVSHRHLRLKSGADSTTWPWAGADSTTWPWPWSKGPFNDRFSPAHKARYAPHTLTPADAMELAGIADAYTTLITHPCNSVRERMHELHVAYDLWCRGALSDSTPTLVPDDGARADPTPGPNDDQGSGIDRGGFGPPL